MRVLVVLAHPCDDSFTHAVADAAVRGFTRAGHHVELIDLDAAGSTVAMTAEEWRAYHGDDPLLDPLARRHAEQVLAADCLAFVYPTWWSGLPAILKGWLERVMVPGVAFRFDEAGRVRPNLGNVRRIVGISTYGSPRRYVRLVNDNGRRIIGRALRLNTGLRTRVTWLALYSIDTATAGQREAFLRHVEARTARVRG